MNIEIQSHNFPLTFADDDYIRNRLIFALTANQSDIDTVQVWLADVSGIESTRLKYCLIDAKLVNGSSVISDCSDSQVYIAIHRAADRAGWEVARSVGRQQRDSLHFQSSRSRNNSRPEMVLPRFSGRFHKDRLSFVRTLLG
jgi:putative sigma-54 modulation protein